MATQIRPNSRTWRWLVVTTIAGVALFGSYAFAQSKSAGISGSGDVVSGPVAVTTQGGGGSACACCGGGAAAPASALAPKAAELAGGVQTISVDVSQGYYDPSTIELKADVPAEITFSQASGCTAQVQSRDLGFSEDLSSGPKTVKLAALQPGTYSFECGMSMVFGSIVVK